MRKRSKYRPRPVCLDPLSYALTSMKPISSCGEHILNLKIKNHSAMNALLFGKATRSDMDILIAMSNICEALYRLGFGTEYKNVVSAGLESLYQIGARGYATDTFICKLPEVAAMNDLMELHNAQMEVITVRDMERALEVVKREFQLKKMRVIEVA